MPQPARKPRLWAVRWISGSQVAVNGSGADRFLEMNHLAGQGTGHSLHGLDLGDDQSSERINVIGSNANNRVIRASNNDGGDNPMDLTYP